MFLTQNVSPDRRDPQMGITVWPKENGKKLIMWEKSTTQHYYSTEAKNSVLTK